MAAGDYTFGAVTALPDIDRLDNLASGSAMAFGFIDNTVVGAVGYAVRITVPINTLATVGTYTLYLLESLDNVNWTDAVSPASAADRFAAIAQARLISVAGTIYDATDRTAVNSVFSIEDVGQIQPYMAFILKNESGLAIPAGAAGDYVTKQLS